MRGVPNTIIIPDCNASYWEVVTRPLLEKLKRGTGETATEILKWGKHKKLTMMLSRNLIAWLSFRGLIAFDTVKGVWIAQ